MKRQGNNAGARVQFQKALEVDPKLPGIHFEMGALLNLSDDATTKAEAESGYKAAVAENALVAYETPGGKYVVIVANISGTAQTFQIRFHGESVSSTLSGGAVATYVW